MKNRLLLLLFLVCTIGIAQVNTPEDASFNPDTLMKPRNTNPVIFADMLVGGAGGGSKGIVTMLTLNFEWHENLITARYTNLTNLNAIALSPFVPLPLFYIEEEIEEAALLFGRRYTNYNVAWSFSAGISHNLREKLDYSDSEDYHYNKITMIGVPFEASVKWFKGRRRPYRIYGIIPVGSSVAFGNSIGFKLFGNISKTSFVGLGITFGFGFHKQY